MKIDLKSALCGLAVGVLAMAAMGAGGSSPIGRYQVAGGYGFFTIVDTTTGQAWGANCSSPGMSGAQPGYWDVKAK
jgi:hypothetical protein